jgi:hypothetical protein
VSALLKTGDKVWLRADPTEGWQRESATVLEPEVNGCITVQLSNNPLGETWMTGPNDDGIREVTVDQIESEQETLRHELHRFLELMAGMHGKRREGWVYDSPYHFLLEHGREFLPSDPRDGFQVVRRALRRLGSDRSLRVKQCFANAANVVLADSTGRLSYCEGFGLRHVPAHHAWVVLDGEVVLDVTWNKVGSPLHSAALTTKILGRFEDIAYFGVILGRERLASALAETECYESLLMGSGFNIYSSRFNAAKEK